jgi:hypothetical protein
VEVGEERTRRAVAWIGVAALGTVVAGVLYLRPSLAPPMAATPPTPARAGVPASAWSLVSASFVDANDGTVQLCSSELAPATSFLTSDGGRTWHLAARAPRNGYAFAAFLDSRTVLEQTIVNLGSVNAGPVETRISQDAGWTWRPFTDPRHNPGLGAPGFLDPKHAWWVHRAPSQDPWTPVAIWRTTDGGSTQGGSSVDYTPFASVSDDGGLTWSQPRAGPNFVRPWYVGAFATVDTRRRLLLVDERRLWISDDGGATWASRLMQAPADLRPAMLVSAVQGALFALAAQTGPAGMVTSSSPLTLIRSTDDGAHWSAVNLPRSPPPAGA